MACLLTKGFAVDCMEGNGGIAAIYFANFDLVDEITTSSADIVTGITMVGGAKFYKYEFRKEVSVFSQNPTPSQENGTLYYEQTTTAILDKQDTDKRNEIKLLNKSRTMQIVEDNNGVLWLMGETRGADLSSGEITTGTAYGDRNGYSFTFVAKEPNMAKEVDPSVLASIT